jgi:hypothetical protein
MSIVSPRKYWEKRGKDYYLETVIRAFFLDET